MENIAVVLGIILVLLQIGREFLEIYKDTDDSDDQ